MLDKAEERVFKPEYIMFDIWYASVKNLKAIRKKQWRFLTRLKSNRLVNLDNTKNILLMQLRFHIKELQLISKNTVLLKYLE